MRIYVASSWRNEYQQAVVQDLRESGHEVYDFMNPKPGNNGFGWREVDPAWKSWTTQQYRTALQHPVAESGYRLDLGGMEWADACVCVLPCGRSAHIEAGWFAGKGRPLFFLIPPTGVEPELMYLLAGAPTRCIHDSMASLLEALGTPRGLNGPEIRTDFDELTIPA